MTVKIEKLERVFLFNGSKLPDVNPEFSVEQVRDTYVNTYPELATAAVELATEVDTGTADVVDVVEPEGAAIVPEPLEQAASPKSCRSAALSPLKPASVSPSRP